MNDVVLSQAANMNDTYVANPKYVISLELTALKQVENERFVKHLGIHFGHKLRWDVHIPKICSKLSKVVSMLRRLMESLPSQYLRPCNVSFSPVFCYM